MIDLAIIGAGPAGYVAAERAGAKGLSVVLFEKRELGGVCLNEGCIPTKTLLYSSKMYKHAAEGAKYGVKAISSIQATDMTACYFVPPVVPPDPDPVSTSENCSFCGISPTAKNTPSTARSLTVPSATLFILMPPSVSPSP